MDARFFHRVVHRIMDLTHTIQPKLHERLDPFLHHFVFHLEEI